MIVLARVGLATGPPIMGNQPKRPITRPFHCLRVYNVMDVGWVCVAEGQRLEKRVPGLEQPERVLKVGQEVRFNSRRRKESSTVYVITDFALAVLAHEGLCTTQSWVMKLAPADCKTHACRAGVRPAVC